MTASACPLLNILEKVVDKRKNQQHPTYGLGKVRTTSGSGYMQPAEQIFVCGGVSQKPSEAYGVRLGNGWLASLGGSVADAARGGDASSTSGGNEGGNMGPNAHTHTHTHTHSHTHGVLGWIAG